MAKKSKRESILEEIPQEKVNEGKIPHVLGGDLGLVMMMTGTVRVDREAVKEDPEEETLTLKEKECQIIGNQQKIIKPKPRKVSDNFDSDEGPSKKLKTVSIIGEDAQEGLNSSIFSTEGVSKITPIKLSVPGLKDVLGKFVNEERDLAGTINELKKIRDEKRSTNRRIALVLTKAFEGEDLSDEDRKDIGSYHGVINLQESYDRIRAADNKKAYIQEILEQLKRTKAIGEDSVSTQTS